jgi:hypothetical protein
VLARDADAVGRAAPAEREANVARRDARAAGHDHVGAVAAPLEPLEDLAALDRQLVAARDVAPQIDQLLLRVARAVELAEERQLDRLHHHELAPRILRDRPSDLLLLEHHEREPLGLRLQCTRDAGRTRADDREVVGVGGSTRARRAHAARDLGRDRRAVRDRRADQRVAGDLAREVDAGQARDAERFVEHRDVAPLREVAERQRDRADRAGGRARAVSDAARAVGDERLSVDDLEHAVLGARAYARRASDAPRQVDMRVLEARLGAAAFLRARHLGQARAHRRELAATSERRERQGGDHDDQERQTQAPDFPPRGGEDVRRAPPSRQHDEILIGRRDRDSGATRAPRRRCSRECRIRAALELR